MASAATPSRIGDINAGGGDVTELFLKVFSGEVLAAFARRNVMLQRSIVRTITSGKSAQFPAVWRASSAYHTPGAELAGVAINHNERVIDIDGLLISHVFIADIDDAMNHYDVRSIYSSELGQALARQLDAQILNYGALGADAAATLTGGDAGTEIVDADADTNADSLVTSIFDAAQALDEHDVPSEDRYCFVKPAEYYNLIENGTKVVHQDYRGEGSIAAGSLARVAGFEIVPSNNMAQDLSAASATNWPSATLKNFSNVVAQCMHKSAVGTVKLMDLEMQSDYDYRRQGTLLIARMATGSDFLRPEASVMISKVAFVA
jgi:hypothetical protein